MYIEALARNLPDGVPWLSLTWLITLAAALVIMVLPRQKKEAMRWVATIASGLSLLITLLLYFSYNLNDPGYRGLGLQFVERLPWMPQLGISYLVGADGINLPMLILTGFIIFTGSLISWNIEERTKEYFVLLLLLVTGVYGVFMALDLFLFFVFYELAVLPMYLLIGVWGSTRKEYGAMKLTLYLMAGSAAVIIAMVAVYFGSGMRTFDMVELALFGRFTREFQALFFLPMFLGFAVLAGMFPFHTWSPTGHVAAPTAVSMLHAGVLMKLGSYGALRAAMWLMPEGAQLWLPWIAIITVANVVYGATIAMVQRDFKFVIGYSSVSHMGLVVMALATMNTIGLSGAVLQMFAHGIMTGLFFAVVGRMVYDRTHTRQFPELGGLAKVMPFAAVLFVIGGLSSMGMPGFAGFIAEFNIFIGVWERYPLIAIIAALSIPITAAYVLRVTYLVFFGEVKDPHFLDLPPLTGREKFAGAMLAAILILVGVYPTIMTDMAADGVTEIVARLQQAAQGLALR
ncbi:MAG: NADH dehydrogenase subunit M [Herpetosiphonaceae bacterium]|nr:MAG: NADH dehydrogenase subunit M [Herpetosiphonaceae bacterium]